jgi:hypothetical protein
MLRRNPGFAAVTILTLALGIGVNTGVFSVINAVLLRSLPYPDANRIVAFSDGINASNPERFKAGIEGADFAEWRARAKSFEKMAGYNYADGTLATRETASQTRVISIAGDFWTITGARSVPGRLFEPGESQNSIRTFLLGLQASVQRRSRHIWKNRHPRREAHDRSRHSAAGVPVSLPARFLELARPGRARGVYSCAASLAVRAFAVVRDSKAKTPHLQSKCPGRIARNRKRGLEDYPDRWFPVFREWT